MANTYEPTKKNGPRRRRSLVAIEALIPLISSDESYIIQMTQPNDPPVGAVIGLITTVLVDRSEVERLHGTNHGDDLDRMYDCSRLA